MIKFLSIFPCVVFVTAAIAHDGTVTISGTIQDNTCELAPDSKNKIVNMGEMANTQFRKAGDASIAKSFTIDLQNCGPAANEAEITFSGTTDSKNNDLFAIEKGIDSATGVALGLYDAEGQQLLPDKHSSSIVLKPNESSVAIEYMARYVAVMDDVTAGKANVALTFVLNYQ